MKLKNLILGFVVLMLFVSLVYSQEGYRKSWALIIGINEYQSLPRLNGAVRSAKMIREKLVREFGFDPENVIELYDDQATRENILKAFDRLMDPRRVSKEDRIFIYFAGHGVTRQVGGKDKGYIMPVDGVMEKYASTAISTDQLHEFQEAIPAKHVFFAMDACYSGTIFTRGIGLAVKNLETGETFFINENLIFPQGSAIKIPILIEVIKQASEGKFKLTDKIKIEKKHQVGGSGVLKEFGDGTSELSIYDLAVLMITVSDNTATNILIDLVGMENVNKTLEKLGLKNTKLQRKMIRPDASARGEENLSTPLEAMKLMEMLYKGEVISKEISNQVIDILK
ncbi:Caspase domain-containing protein, partial [Candidatus Kryptonium thompsonii]